MSNNELEFLLFRAGATNGLFGADWVTLLALLAVATLYLLTPVFGYRTGGRGLLLAALWMFLARLGLGLLRVCIFAMEFLDRPRSPMSGSGGTWTTLQGLLLLSTVLETGLFVLGLVLFVLGLSFLRRETPLPRSPFRNFPEE